MGEIFLVYATCSRKEIISKAYFPAPAAFFIIIILNKNNLIEFKHVMAQMRAICLILYLPKIAALSNIKSTCLKSLISYPIHKSNSTVSIR